MMCISNLLKRRLKIYMALDKSYAVTVDIAGSNERVEYALREHSRRLRFRSDADNVRLTNGCIIIIIIIIRNILMNSRETDTELSEVFLVPSFNSKRVRTVTVKTGHMYRQTDS